MLGFASRGSWAGLGITGLAWCLLVDPRSQRMPSAILATRGAIIRHLDYSNPLIGGFTVNRRIAELTYSRDAGAG
jgi:hypothetical protein